MEITCRIVFDDSCYLRCTFDNQGGVYVRDTGLIEEFDNVEAFNKYVHESIKEHGAMKDIVFNYKITRQERRSESSRRFLEAIKLKRASRKIAKEFDAIKK